MKLHSLSENEALGAMKSRAGGLSSFEAHRRLAEVGPNVIEGSRRPSLLRRIAAQFSDFMIIALIVSAIISMGISYVSGDGGFTDAMVILAIVALNAAVGIFQENRAFAAMEALKKLTPEMANVRRDDTVQAIEASSVVPGDILLLSAGEKVPADCRIISSVDLTVDESVLTGESLPVEKNAEAICGEDTPLSERTNLVFASTLIETGRGEALVFSTGMQTEVGRVAALLDSEKTEETPLQKKLDALGKQLAWGALLCCFFVFLMGLFRHFPPLPMFMTAVSLAVAAIPEGLPAAVTVILALGVSRMAKKRAVIRHLPAVETLGGATVICSDKTGTLTQNRMTVEKTMGEDTLMWMALCSDADGTGATGTENALIAAYEGDLSALRRRYRRVAEVPFSSKRRRMTTVHRLPTGGFVTVVKGAFDAVLSQCKEGGDALRQCERWASEGYRVIAVAISIGQSAKPKEDAMTFVGAAALADPLRPEVAEAARSCRRAGITVIMLTGDHKETALSIARQLKLGSEAITGAELSSMSDDELRRALTHVRVFARVLPEHKVRLVKMLQAMGHVVAMTGDGVNDAPAIAGADIGCAMGQGGTEVARQAADMILTDDNFATIVAAISEGRTLYDNIRKAVHFLLSCNIGEILVMLIGMLCTAHPPLLPLQLLWVNLITDSLPALALGMDEAEDDVMQRPPKARKRFFEEGEGSTMFLEGCLIGAVSLTAFASGRFSAGGGEAVARTMAFCTLSLSQLVHAFALRSDKSVFVHHKRNVILYLAFLLGATMQVITASVPVLMPLFRTVALSARQWMQVAAFSLVPLITSEGEKFIKARCKEK